MYEYFAEHQRIVLLVAMVMAAFSVYSGITLRRKPRNAAKPPAAM